MGSNYRNRNIEATRVEMSPETGAEAHAERDSGSRTGEAIATFDLAAVRRFADLAVEGLSDAREEIDALNVYPVPDGFREIGRVGARAGGSPAVTVDGAAYEGVAGHTHF